MSIDMIEISAQVIKEKPLALLIDDGGGRVWVPKSQISTGINDGDYRTDGYVYTIVMAEWLAEEKGLI